MQKNLGYNQASTKRTGSDGKVTVAPRTHMKEIKHMAYTLDQLSQDIRQTLKADDGPSGRQTICQFVSKALLDKEFIAQHVTAEQCKPRKVLHGGF